MIDTILVPLDGSPLAEHGLHAACRLARETRATLLLLAATPFSMVADANEREKERAALRNTQHYLRRTRQSLESQGFTVRVQVLPGNAVTAILFTAEAEQVGVISMATHGHTGIRQTLLGSVAEAVARASTTPLLLTRGADKSSPREVSPYRRILVALDGTPFAETAVRFLAAQGLGHTSEVVLLRAVMREQVWPIPMAMPGNELTAIYRDAEEHTDRCRQEAEDYLRALGAEWLAAWTWKPAVALDDPASAILEAARATRADLIALTTHVRHGLNRLLHGSVAHEVLKRAEASVLLLHGSDEAPETQAADRAAARPTADETAGEPIAAGQIN